jgi:hypothetical protein
VSLDDLLATTVGLLEAEGIPYMLTGSIASAFHGEPRGTRDIDVVIDPTPDALDRLISRLHEHGTYVDADGARAALRERTQFNAVAGDAKVDFIVRKERPFSRAEFERRSRVQLPGMAAAIVTVEDLILVKLEWAAAIGSGRQLRDVAGMVTVAGAGLDRGYIEGWAARLGLSDAWRELLETLAEQ